MLLTATLNSGGALVSTRVAKLIDGGLVDPQFVTPTVVLVLMHGAVAWVAAKTCVGVPVSTTHTITGAIMGVGATRRLSAVRWGLGSKILMAWVFTLPMTALIAALVYRGLNLVFGLV
ncbi:MAG: inorganic phosphate transporter [Planctomycetota bacterium]|nr:inorganic phosphate transporter [Planctomycetota bacterium]